MSLHCGEEKRNILVLKEQKCFLVSRKFPTYLKFSDTVTCFILSSWKLLEPFIIFTQNVELELNSKSSIFLFWGKKNYFT